MQKYAKVILQEDLYFYHSVPKIQERTLKAAI